MMVQQSINATLARMLSVLIYLAAAVILVPIFARLKLGSILGYIAAGALIGPFGLKLIKDPESVAQVAELGVVFLLFVIGLELKPKRLWVLRRLVFGLGLAQVLVTGLVLAGIGVWLFERSFKVALIIGLALALSSTAFAIQLLTERRELATRAGRKAFSILLFQDMAVVPLIALIPALGALAQTGSLSFTKALSSLLLLIAIIALGRLVLSPALRLVAHGRSREIFTAAALLLVLGMASLFHALGLSLALGAFVAGVLLADSEFRHQLEADIEPFRGLLLGLFFMAVGMSVSVPVLREQPGLVVGLALGLLAVKALIVVVLVRFIGGASWSVGARTALVVASGGEFAFVVFTVAVDAGLLSEQGKALLVAVVILSMLAAPLLMHLSGFVERLTSDSLLTQDLDADNQEPAARVLVLGFGRVGKIISKVLRDADISFMVLENSPEAVRQARANGQPVQFGDCKRAEVLRAAGALSADLILVSFSDADESVRAVRAIKHHFPHAKVLARSGHRTQTLELMEARVDFVVSEAFEAALALSKAMLRELHVDELEAQATVDHFRDRDQDEFLEALRVRRIDSELN